MTRQSKQPPTKYRLGTKILVWVAMILVVGAVGFLLWRDLAAGRWFRLLIVVIPAGYIGWRAYRQAKQAARS